MSQDVENKVTSEDDKVPLTAPIRPAHHKPHTSVDCLHSRDSDSMLVSAQTGLQTLSYGSEEESSCRRDQSEEAESKMDRDNNRVGVNQQTVLLEILISVGEKLDRHRESCDHLTKLLGQLSDAEVELKATFYDTILKLKELGVFQREGVPDMTYQVEISNQMDQDSKANWSKAEEREVHSNQMDAPEDSWRNADDRECPAEPSRGVKRACASQSSSESPTLELSLHPVAMQAPVVKGQQPQGSPKTNTDMSCTEKNLLLLREEAPDWGDIVNMESLGEMERRRSGMEELIKKYVCWCKKYTRSLLE